MKTEHKNAIKRRDLRSLTSKHTYDKCYTFNWKETHLLRRAQIKHGREFKEAWYSTDDNTINRRINIPTVYLQLKTVRKVTTNNNININNSNNIVKNNINNIFKNLPTTATRQSNHTTNPDSKVHSSMATNPSTTNDVISTSKTPIRRYTQCIHNLGQQRKT